MFDDRFAAALYDHGVDCWVMNVVPVSDTNTLPVIYDRGLIGVVHDWYEQLFFFICGFFKFFSEQVFWSVLVTSLNPN